MATIPDSLGLFEKGIPRLSRIDCLWHHVEYLLLGRVPPALLREAWSHGMSGPELLELLLEPLRGSLFYEHLQDPKSMLCKLEMGIILEFVSTTLWGDNMHLTLREALRMERGNPTYDKHVKSCSACARYSGYIRSLRPNLDDIKLSAKVGFIE